MSRPLQPVPRVRADAPLSVPPVRRASGGPDGVEMTWAAGSDASIQAPRLSESGPVMAGPAVPRRIGNYDITGFLGSGGMADVYLGVHPVLGRKAAIKLLRRELLGDSGLRQRFLQEARITDRLRHPNIVEMLDVGQTLDGRLYLVMELLEGMTLASRLDEGKLDTGEAIAILIQLCAGLRAAHDAGVVHRDLKPDNIFLTHGESGLCVKILDWGVARDDNSRGRRDADSGLATPRLTSDGLVVGTPLYIAPEQARGLSADSRSDVYALGVVAYEMFLGAPPFTGGTAVDLMYRHLRETPTAPSTIWRDIPPALEALLFGLLAKIPELRPSLDDMCTALEGVAASLTDRSSGEIIRAGAIAPPAVESFAAGTPPASATLAAGSAAGNAASAPSNAYGADGRDTWIQISLANADDDDMDLLLVAPVAELHELSRAAPLPLPMPDEGMGLDQALDELSAES
jgi:tRNA A-37 threonylcarbamoyl transferase component Bud32